MKRYIKPTMSVVEVETESIMAASLTDKIDNDNQLDNPSDMLSKDHKFNIWGDDEE